MITGNNYNPLSTPNFRGVYHSLFEGTKKQNKKQIEHLLKLPEFSKCPNVVIKELMLYPGNETSKITQFANKALSFITGSPFTIVVAANSKKEMIKANGNLLNTAKNLHQSNLHM